MKLSGENFGFRITFICKGKGEPLFGDMKNIRSRPLPILTIKGT